MPQLVEHRGNHPSNVSKDAKYRVAADGQSIRLVFRTSHDEEYLITTHSHPELAGLVNSVKLAASGSPGGIFYLDEFGHIVVPAGDGPIYY